MPAPFTTRDEIERLFSADAVQVRIDDAADILAETDVIDEVIADATEFVWQYLWTRYAEAQVVNRDWVRRRATYVAAHFLSQRRGNPGQFIDRFEQIKEELQLVYTCALHVPDAQVNTVQQPVVSNYVVDNRNYGPVIRVTEDSTGGYPEQRTTLNHNIPEII